MKGFTACYTIFIIGIAIFVSNGQSTTEFDEEISFNDNPETPTIEQDEETELPMRTILDRCELIIKSILGVGIGAITMTSLFLLGSLPKMDSSTNPADNDRIPWKDGLKPQGDCLGKNEDDDNVLANKLGYNPKAKNKKLSDLENQSVLEQGETAPISKGTTSNNKDNLQTDNESIWDLEKKFRETIKGEVIMNNSNNFKDKINNLMNEGDPKQVILREDNPKKNLTPKKPNNLDIEKEIKQTKSIDNEIDAKPLPSRKDIPEVDSRGNKPKNLDMKEDEKKNPKPNPINNPVENVQKNASKSNPSNKPVGNVQKMIDTSQTLQRTNKKNAKTEHDTGKSDKIEKKVEISPLKTNEKVAESNELPVQQVPCTQEESQDRRSDETETAIQTGNNELEKLSPKAISKKKLVAIHIFGIGMGLLCSLVVDEIAKYLMC